MAAYAGRRIGVRCASTVDEVLGRREDDGGVAVLRPVPSVPSPGDRGTVVRAAVALCPAAAITVTAEHRS
ncbi:ferredoxin [Streptomyces sp. NPDC059134]|uniref:ferredoxin n=1 Tax=Streptomyces sp. NPDC059134 TaxID=3346738 RepID=UPI0036866D9A